MLMPNLAHLVLVVLSGCLLATPLVALESIAIAPGAAVPTIPHAGAITTAAPEAQPVVEEINALIDRAVSHGFPDARQGTLFIGDLAVADLAPYQQRLVKEDFALRKKVMKVDDRGVVTERGAVFRHLHLRFASGAWLAGMRWLLDPAQVTVDATRVREVAPSNAFSALTGCLHEVDPWFGINITIPGRTARSYTLVERWDLATWQHLTPLIRDRAEHSIAVVHLIRLGVPEALAGLADSYRYHKPTTFQMSGVADWPGSRMALWFRNRLTLRHHPVLDKHGDNFRWPQEPLAQAKHLLLAWFHDQLLRPDAILSPERAIGGLRALLGNHITPAQAQLLRLFEERARLPRSLPADADVDTRVMCWEGSLGTSGYCFVTFEKNVRDLTESVHPSPALAWRLDRLRAAQERPFTATDLPDLIHLIDDQRASAWLDQLDLDDGDGFPRTVGDNALRIIATVLQEDPRVLMGHDPQALWNDQERTALAAAMAAWWRDTEGHSPQERIAASMDRVRLDAARGVIERLPAGLQSQARRNLFERLQRQPPMEDDFESIADALIAIREEPQTAALVASWPDAINLLLVKSVWQAGHGDLSSLDRLLDHFCGPVAMGDAEPCVIWIAGVFGDRPRLRRVLDQLDRDHQHPAFRALFHCGTGYVHDPWNSSLVNLADLLAPQVRAQRELAHDHPVNVLELLIREKVLRDVRPLPPGLITVSPGVEVPNKKKTVRLSLEITLTTRPSHLISCWTDTIGTIAPDFRICDVIATSMFIWENNSFPIDKPIPIRDAYIDEHHSHTVRGQIERVLAKSGLPWDLLPAERAPSSNGNDF